MHQIDRSDVGHHSASIKPLSFNQGIYYNFSNLQTERIRPAMNQKSSPQNLKLEPGLNLHEALKEIMSNSASPTMGSCKGHCTSQSGCPFQATEISIWMQFSPFALVIHFPKHSRNSRVYTDGPDPL